ncbi:SDR family NAD(P)-dependent oxidoreductase [Amycolatopsis methanolica]|uniref:Short-chain dehydrogenase/reductase SDR n=1 Tax=Amycolatopsis methanolica 239 TaxID=1068978 RepID=A0A076MTX2_AMYME|nr:SDR family oxidoreductase [Amycolatopsis methanolica]AIJ24383.1 short-chain dehydrogenase/reductase SDR [Amycolatopsis methanolica 239]
MRHVLVTGAASGIGAAIAARFRGDRLTLADVDGDRLAAVAAELGAECRVGDLADARFAESLVDSGVDVLVNAAGIYPATPLLEMTAAKWDRVQDVNVRAAMLTTVAFGQSCVAAGRSGVVVNISSGAATRARPGAAHYATSKAALEMLTKACAVELGPHGIRVNAVSPGFVTVDSAANPVTEEYAAAVSVNPLGRRGRPADIAEAVHWLAGEQAAWITGAVLRVDGGSTAGAPGLPLHWDGATAVQEGSLHV